jgi:hypothetical protein
MEARWQSRNWPKVDQRGAAGQDLLNEEGTLAGQSGEQFAPNPAVV